jgi:hypothetical protein
MEVDLCDLHAWSLILREKHRLKVFENRVLRRKFCIGGKARRKETTRKTKT